MIDPVTIVINLDILLAININILLTFNLNLLLTFNFGVLLSILNLLLPNKVLSIKIVKLINIDKIVGMSPRTIKLDNPLIIPIQTSNDPIPLLKILTFF